MLFFVLVDIHVVKLSGIVLCHVHHSKGRIDSRQAVPQSGPHPCKHLVADQVHDNFSTCSTDRHFRFADKVVRRRRGFWHLLSLDGAWIAAATTCCIDNCPSCECPKSELANTEASWQLRTVREVKQAVDAARAQLLNADGTVKEGSRTKV